jgi:hypothetical protein
MINKQKTLKRFYNGNDFMPQALIIISQMSPSFDFKNKISMLKQKKKR